jgi:membrane-associated phospholipid phosphatase
MKSYKIILLIILLLSNASYNSIASDSDNNNNIIRITPFTDIDKNFIDSYAGWNSLYHISAVGLTYISVNSGLDAKILRLTSGMDPAFSSVIGHTGLFLGYLAPIAVPATLYFVSEKNSDLRIASYAVMQSVAIAFAVGSLLKAITGRSGPNPDSRDKDILSKDFKFGFLQGGLHYGWPSGHLMTNTAMATALATFYSEKTWVKNVAYGYIAFLTFSMLIHDRGTAHWFSDIIAGGLMGIAFGTTIGKGFRNYRNPLDYNPPATNSATFIQLYPLFNPDITGVSIIYSF